MLAGLENWNGSATVHPYFVVDVFTSRALEGNQLGVFVDGSQFSEDEMQRLARELKFAETVFLLPPEHGGDVRVRIFTPTNELPFAGHPMIGTARVVGEALGARELTLEVPAGPVHLRLEGDGFAWMAGPLPVREPFDRVDEVLAAVGVRSSGLPVELYRSGPLHVYVNLPSEDDVAALRPDMAALERLDVAVNCFTGDGTKFKTRMFFPASGVIEDAATGSAAGALAVHLLRHGRIEPGETIEIRQGEEIGRPSHLYARAHGRGDELERVEVGGAAVIVARGHYRIS